MSDFFTNDPTKPFPVGTEIPYIIPPCEGEGGGGVQSIVAGDGIAVDDTDPLNPIVSATGGFIPLTGTETGSPVTGSVEITDSNGLVLTSEPGGAPGAIITSTGLQTINGSNTIYVNGEEIGFSNLSGTLLLQAGSFTSNQDQFELTFNGDNPKGMVGTADFSANYDDLTYVQKIYVDGLITPLAGMTPAMIENPKTITSSPTNLANANFAGTKIGCVGICLEYTMVVSCAGVGTVNVIINIVNSLSLPLCNLDIPLSLPLVNDVISFRVILNKKNVGGDMIGTTEFFRYGSTGLTSPVGSKVLVTPEPDISIILADSSSRVFAQCATDIDISSDSLNGYLIY